MLLGCLCGEGRVGAVADPRGGGGGVDCSRAVPPVLPALPALERRVVLTVASLLRGAEVRVPVSLLVGNLCVPRPGEVDPIAIRGSVDAGTGWVTGIAGVLRWEDASTCARLDVRGVASLKIGNRVGLGGHRR